jgi:hypothetical protein
MESLIESNQLLVLSAMLLRGRRYSGELQQCHTASHLCLILMDNTFDALCKIASTRTMSIHVSNVVLIWHSHCAYSEREVLSSLSLSLSAMNLFGIKMVPAPPDP